MQPIAHTVVAPSSIPPTPELLRIARRLIWWMPPQQALEYPARFIAQVMTLGTWDDVEQVRTAVGEGCLRAVLQEPPAGVFDPPSWHYWHHYFGVWAVPDLPRRRIP